MDRNYEKECEALRFALDRGEFDHPGEFTMDDAVVCREGRESEMDELSCRIHDLERGAMSRECKDDLEDEIEDLKRKISAQATHLRKVRAENRRRRLDANIPEPIMPLLKGLACR